MQIFIFSQKLRRAGRYGYLINPRDANQHNVPLLGGGEVMCPTKDIIC